MSRHIRAFTLVELLIVVIILGIVAAIVVPQFSQAGDDTQMSAMTADLRAVRGQIELYRAQHNGAFPALASFANQLTAKTNADGSTTGSPALGPYLRNIPNLPFTGTNSVSAGAVGSSAWYYNELTGEFKANDTAGHAAY